MSGLIRQQLGASMEVIDVQSDVFFKELTNIFSKYLGMKRRELFDSDFKDELKACIVHNFCDDLEIHMGSPYNEFEDVGYALGMYIPTKNNALFKDVFRTIGLKASVKVKVDYAKARIVGDISVFKPTMYVEAGLIIRSSLTAKEHAAVVLHEIGHFFHNFAFTNRFTTTNQAVAIAAKDMLTAGGLKQKQFLIQDAAKQAEIELSDEEAAMIENSEQLMVVLNNKLIQKIRSELGSDTYDMTMNEFMADQFAVRHGAGRYIASGLTALFKDRGMTAEQYQVRRTVEITSMLGRIAFMIYIGVQISFTVIGMLNMLGVLVFILSIYLTVVPSYGEFIYDRDRDRIQRIRNQMQVYLRKKNLSKKEYEKIKADLDEVDELLDHNTNEWSLLATTVAKILSPRTRRRNSEYELHALLEQLAYTQLHDRAAALRFA